MKRSWKERRGLVLSLWLRGVIASRQRYCSKTPLSIVITVNETLHRFQKKNANRYLDFLVGCNKFKSLFVIFQSILNCVFSFILTNRHGPLRGPTSSSCGGLRPRAFFALRAKKWLIMLFWPIFCNFLCPIVTLLTFSSNLSKF